MRFLITGAAGFIGSHLSDKLVADGHEVYGLDNFETGLEQNVNDRVKFEEIDLGNPFADELEALFNAAKPDVVLHCAASYKDPDDWVRDIDTNIYGTCQVLRQAQRFQSKIVYFQTSLCYGKPQQDPITLSHPLNPETSYAISKVAAELYVRLSGLQFLVFRLANVFGPRNLSGPIPTFYKKLSSGEPCTVTDTRRDFVYIEDLLDAVARGLNLGATGVFHVASGGDMAIWSLYHLIGFYTLVEPFGSVAEKVPEPELVPSGADDVKTLKLDPSKTITQLGWTQSFKKNLADQLRDTVEWYRDNGVKETYTHLKLPGGDHESSSFAS